MVGNTGDAPVVSCPPDMRDADSLIPVGKNPGYGVAATGPGAQDGRTPE
jgi:hypothetical protein